MARTIRRVRIAHDRGPLALIVMAVVTAGVMGLARWDAPVALAEPTANGYTLVQDVNTATFNQMVDFAVIPGTNNAEAIVVSQTDEKIYRVSLSGAFTATEYGDLSSYVGGGGFEEGLLSATFSPNFVTDRRIYVYYTQGGDASLPTVLSRFPVNGNVMNTSMGSETRILLVPDFASNHNGGRLLFGPDGYLYLSLGDGGGGGDPAETGQNNDDLLGSVLRINVTGQATYTIPPGNPFADGPGGDADEVWAYGLRNPWRYSFDRVSGDLWLADVGQGAWEEVEKIVSGGNYGWDCWEGNSVYEDVDCSSPPTPFLFPRAVYDHGLGCSVTGGYVYRGTSLPEIYGWYIYGDYCSGTIWAVNPAGTSLPLQLVDTDFNIVSFAELPNGELLVITFQNSIQRLTCAATPDTDSDGQGNACDPDDDNDEFSDAIESYVGTDLLLDCGTDAWPADVNNDGFSDISDISALAGSFGKPVPPAPARHNIAPEPPDGVVDITDISRVAGLFGQGCSLSGGVLATFDVAGERFKAWVTNAQTVQQLFDLQAGKSSAHIPSGRIFAGAGRGGHNMSWTWHLDPVDIQMADAAIEVCDATPSYVEANRDYFVGTVGQYCPWSAQLVELVDYR
jgi:glucose/arabinose dehydrogenase